MTNTNNTTKTQTNYYRIYDSMGRPTDFSFCASNIKEATQIARQYEQQLGSRYYKVKRCYNGGVRGSDNRF